MEHGIKNQCLTFLLAFLLIHGSVYAQWQMAEGLEGGGVVQMVDVDSVLFVSTMHNGIFSEVDGSWEEVYDMPNTRYSGVISVGNCVLIYNDAYGNQCMRSFDKGINWEPAPIIGDVSDMWRMDSILFFFREDHTLLKSIDYGTSVDTVTVPDECTYPEVFMDDTLMYLYQYSSTDDNKIFYSYNYGETWDSLNTSGLFWMPSFIQDIKFINNTFWAVSHHLSAPYSAKRINVYDQMTHEWEDVTSNLPFFRSLMDIIEYEGKILCALYKMPVYSFNFSDSTWTTFSDGSKGVNSFNIISDSLFCCTDQGPCYLDSSGIWHERINGLNFRDITSIDIYDDYIYVTASNELFYSVDGGTTFSKINSAYGYQILTTDSVFYLVSEVDLFISRDMGMNWLSCTDGVEFSLIQQLVHLSITENYYYLATLRGLYKSPSIPIQWEIIEDPFWGTTLPIEKVETINYSVLVGINFPHNKLYFSQNSANSFTVLRDFDSFFKIDNTYYILSDSILYYENAGIGWKFILNDIDSKNGIDKTGDTIIVGGRNQGGYSKLQISYDMGDNWFDILGDLPEVYTPYYEISNIFKVVKAINGRVFVNNRGHGLWYRDDLLVGVKDRGNQFSKNRLSVYPNPVKSIANLECDLNKRSSIQFTVYNSIGEVVFEKDEGMKDAGKHRFQWAPASSLSPGLYYGVLRSDDRHFVSKIIKQ